MCPHDPLLPARALAQNEPELPRVFLDTTYSPPTRGKLIPVNAGGDLQAALDASQPGDVIELQAGATFTGLGVVLSGGNVDLAAVGQLFAAAGE